MTRADNVASRIRAAIPERFPIIDEIRIFGSYAKGKATSRSDMDFLILTKEQITDRVLRSKIREDIDEIAAESRIEVDVVFYTFITYNEDDSRFTKELRNNILLYRR